MYTIREHYFKRTPQEKAKIRAFMHKELNMNYRNFYQRTRGNSTWLEKKELETWCKALNISLIELFGIAERQSS